VPGRTHWQCSQRWQKVLQPGLIKGPWTGAEDEKLRHRVALQLEKNSAAISWTEVAAGVMGRTPKQCRERYTLSLDPRINRSPWTEEEDRCIQAMHAAFGSQWAEIREYLPNRTENQIKSRYKTLKLAMIRDSQVRWSPHLVERLFELAERFEGNYARMRSHLPRELKGSSPAALRARCPLIR